jgi:glycerophosphoryl diester phosphodiesterase
VVARAATGTPKAAHGRNLEVHVWTINETPDMQHLVTLVVDGLITDYPDRLMEVLGRAAPRWVDVSGP